MCPSRLGALKSLGRQVGGGKIKNEHTSPERRALRYHGNSPDVRARIMWLLIESVKEPIKQGTITHTQRDGLSSGYTYTLICTHTYFRGTNWIISTQEHTSLWLFLNKSRLKPPLSGLQFTLNKIITALRGLSIWTLLIHARFNCLHVEEWRQSRNGPRRAPKPGICFAIWTKRSTNTASSSSSSPQPAYHP